MLYILSGFLMYVLMVAVHIRVYRFQVKRDRVSFASVWVFFLGVLFQIAVTFLLPQWVVKGESLWFYPLPLSSIALYAFLSGFHIINFTSPYLGDESPSSKILFAVSARGKMSYEDIKKLFTNEQLILKRLRDLERGTCIEKRNGVYRALPAGRRLAETLRLYRKIIGWESSG